MNKIGHEMYGLCEELFPICRSITGEGVRQTLGIIKERVPLKIGEVPTGRKVFDWTIPEEWNIKDAYIKNSKGEKIVDFNKSNLHVLGYSIPVKKKLSLAQLKPHLYTIPERPEWIPYRTSYYKDNWGFCMPHSRYLRLKNDIYEVRIDSSREKGHLTYGELYLKGKISDEILLTCYVCHPSLCNDNLSGIALITFLAEYLQEKERRYSYRFLFIPETIGSIAWLNLNEDKVGRIRHGLVATCVGDPGPFTYKKTRSGSSELDGAAEKALVDSGEPHKIIDFSPTGGDERQFCSPGFNLNVGSLMRTPYAEFPEYHTSADNLGFISPESLQKSFQMYLDTLFILESNGVFLNLNPKCEPHLGKRGLTDMIGGMKEIEMSKKAMLWVLNLSDGDNSLLDISRRSGIAFRHIKLAADALSEKALLRKLK